MSLVIPVMFAILCAVLGTLQHQTRLNGDTPLGLIFSLALVVMSSAAIRDKFPRKSSGLVFTVSMAILIFLFGQSFTQDVLIPSNDLGLIWSYGSIAIAMLVALWPRLKR